MTQRPDNAEATYGRRADLLVILMVLIVIGVVSAAIFLG